MGKNQIYLDVHLTDAAAELARLRDLGAIVLVGPHENDGWLTTMLVPPRATSAA